MSQVRKARYKAAGANRLNWDALGAIAELVGAIGVVASLVYLGIQIRRSTRSTNTAAFQESVRSFQDLTSLIVQNGELAHLLVSGSQNREELSPDDRLRFHSFWAVLFMNMEMGFHYRRNGMLEAEVFDSMSHDLMMYLRIPGVRSWWKSNQESSGVSFRAYVNDVLQQDQAAEG